MKLGFKLALETLTVDSVVGLHNEADTAEIVQGEDFVLYVRLFNLDDSLPFDLTGKTIGLNFLNAAGTVLEIVGAAVSATRGIFSATVTDAQSLLLMLGELQDLELQLVEGSDKRIVKLSDCFTVTEQDF